MILDKPAIMQKVRKMTPDERKFAARAIPSYWPEVRDALLYGETDITSNAAVSLQRVFDGWFKEVHVDGDEVRQPFTYIKMERPADAVEVMVPRGPGGYTPKGYVLGGTLYEPELDPVKARNAKDPAPPVVANPNPTAAEDRLALFMRRKAVRRQCHAMGIRAPEEHDPEFFEKAEAWMEEKRQADAMEEPYVPAKRAPRKVDVTAPPPPPPLVNK